MQFYKDLEQGSQEWLEIRKGVITGTKLESVLGGPKAQLTEIYSLLAEKYLNEEDLKPYEIIERGHQLEPIAKLKYEAMTGNKVEEVGFIKKNEWLGLSPDGLIANDKGIYTKAIEIKCPRGKNFIKYILENKIPDDYRWQVVNYFVVMDELEVLDFIIFNPDVCEGLKSLHIITIKREDLQKDIDKAKEKLDEFKIEWDKMNDILISK